MIYKAIFKAAGVLPHDNGESALDALRGRLRIMAGADGVTPDWTTLDVVGLTEMAGAVARTRIESTASVAAPGLAAPDPGAFVPDKTADDATISFRLGGFAT